jgi:hypothetical protein
LQLAFLPPLLSQLWLLQPKPLSALCAGKPVVLFGPPSLQLSKPSSLTVRSPIAASKVESTIPVGLQMKSKKA